MVKIRFITHDGNEQEVEVSEGTTIMNAAVDNGVAGVVAECGGNMSCATCHVFFDPEWSERLVDPQTMEKEMLEFVVEPHDTSRLGCQIKVTPDMDGITVYLPETQY